MKRFLRIASPLAALLVVGLLGGCSGWQNALDPQGIQSSAVARLLAVFVAVCGIVWLLVMVAMGLAIRRRRRADGTSPLEVDRVADRRLGLGIGAAMVATFLIIIGLTGMSFYSTPAAMGSSSDALVIQVRGWQWWWEIHYPDDEHADQSITTANEIHVPVGRPVTLQLAAGDVIHSFWVPNLTGKRDLVPGRDNSLSFTVRRPGTYRGQCAEFCGMQHAHMSLVVVAESETEFEAWQQRQRARATPPSTDEAHAGLQVFLSKPCASCHAIRGTPAAATLGPDLTHLASRLTIGAGLYDTTRGSIAAWIADPQTLKPGNNMPMVELSAEELQQVSSYLAGLQ